MSISLSIIIGFYKCKFSELCAEYFVLQLQLWIVSDQMFGWETKRCSNYWKMHKFGAWGSALIKYVLTEKESHL